MTIGKVTLAPSDMNLTLKCPGDTEPFWTLRVLGLAPKSIHLKLREGQVVTCVKCRCNNYKFILLLAVLDSVIAISEDLNMKFSRGSKLSGPPWFAHAYAFALPPPPPQ